MFTLVHSNQRKALVDPITCIALDSTDTKLFAGLKRGGIIVIDIVSGSILNKFPAIVGPVDSIALEDNNDKK